MGRLIELAERCEKATGPDRELDLRIAQAVNYGDVFDDCFEWQWGLGGDEIEGWREGRRKPCAYLDPVQFVPRYTASIDAAMKLIPTGLILRRYMASRFVPHSCEVAVDYAHGGWVGNSDHSFALAICASSLRARDGGEGL